MVLTRSASEVEATTPEDPAALEAGQAGACRCDCGHCAAGKCRHGPTDACWRSRRWLVALINCE